MTDYASFLRAKAVTDPATGIVADIANPMLFDFQRDIVRWALRRGRAAVFADCGMGKTPMQLEWARHVPGGDVLILAPLAVAQQTVREGEKFGIPVHYCRSQAMARPGINVTNYEMLDHFEPSRWAGVVLDESSILKAYDGKFRAQITETFSQTPFRLACTATPAPNDFMELGNHAEFLGAMTRAEMLAMFFTHDGGETQTWRLKGHAETEFWRWLCSWAVMVRKPSDLGYDDGAFVLPPLHLRQVTVRAEAAPADGMLFAMEANSLQERLGARRGSIAERVSACADLVNGNDRPWLVWCNLNSEADALRRAIPGAVEVRGSDSREDKEAAVRWFVGNECICGTHLFRSKFVAWENDQTPNTCASTISPTSIGGISEQESSRTNTTPIGENCISPTPKLAIRSKQPSKRAGAKSPILGGPLTSEPSGSHSMITTASSPNKAAGAPSAADATLATRGQAGITSIIVTPPSGSEGCSVRDATSVSGNLVTIPSDLSPRQCTCGCTSQRKVLISKPVCFGFGLNFQHCADVAFVGLSDSWEQYYQAVRRCWRFGQAKPVNVHLITAETEGAVVANIRRKEEDAHRMAENMVEHMHALNEAAIKGMVRDKATYQREVASGKGWTLHLGDCVEVLSEVPDNSLHFSVFSPPFASLYTYSNSDRDMGNCRDSAEFFDHFNFLIPQLFRATMPGRLVSFHCMNLPTSKTRDGVIGIRDFRGDLISAFEAAGWIFHSEVCIWKDPVTAMQRTKALGLLHKQLKKDSCMSRQGIPDYLVTMRKPGDNPERVSHTNDSFPVTLWQRYASPVWMDINPSETLQYRAAREHNDERHIAPLQLEVIRRAIQLWSNPGDLVFSPFAGIGSEGHVALQEGRRFLGAELKPSYWRLACVHLAEAASAASRDLFSEQVA